MRLISAVETYLSGLPLVGEDDHLEQANIILRRFATWLEEPHAECKRQVTDLGDVRTQDVNEFLAFRKRCPGLKKGSKLSPFTLAKEARYLRSFFGYAFADRPTFGLEVTSNPPTVAKIREPQKIPRALEKTELTDVFAACQFARYPIIPGVTPFEWWFALQYIAYITSLRRKGLFSLTRPTEEELDQRILKLPYEGDKCKSDRRFPLTDLAVTVIRYMPAKPGEKLFVWQSKMGRGDYRTFYTEFERMQKAAGIVKDDQSRLHVLRKTSLTHMAEAGVGMSTVQQHAGHASMETTAKHYIGLLDAPRKTAVKNLMVPASPRDPQRRLFDL